MAGKATSTKKPAVRRTATAKTTSTVVRRETPANKPEKPLFSIGTWITILIFAVLIAFMIYLNRAETPIITEATPDVNEPTPLFTAADGIPTSIEVKPAEGGETVRIARNAENVWVVELPFETEADQGLAEASASQVSSLLAIIPVDGKAGDFGLDNPTHTITIIFDGGKKHILEVGDNTPSNSGYYVRIDNDKMVVADLSGIDSLLQLGFFPPYLNTPTPTALPATETPVPTTGAESTLEVTVTPTP